MILLPFCWLYTYSTDDSTFILFTFFNWDHSTGDSTSFLLIVHLFYWWFYSHSTHFLLMILLPFYSHSTPKLLVILLPIYLHSTDHSERLLAGEEIYYPSTGDSTPILLMILLPFYWWFYSHSTGDFNPCCWWFYSHSTCFLLMIQLPFYRLFYSLVHCWDQWFYLVILLPFNWLCTYSDDSIPILLTVFYSTDDSTLILLVLWQYSTDHSTLILLHDHSAPLYWAFYYPSTGDSTPILLMIVLPFYSHSIDESTPILRIILPFYPTLLSILLKLKPSLNACISLRHSGLRWFGEVKKSWTCVKLSC